jgi:drug/metabolite transporter (DMT)-like permease
MLAGSGTMVKIIGVRASVDTVLFVRYLIAFLFVLPWFLKNPKRVLPISQPGQLIGRSVIALVAVGLFIYALRLLSVGDVLTLNSTYTLFIPIVLWALHKIRTPHKMWVGIGVGFIGVLFILKPDPASFNIGSLIALASGVFAAISMVMIRFLTKTMSPMKVVFSNVLIGLVLTAPFLSLDWVSLDGEVLLWLLGAGSFSSAYQILITMALAKGSVRMTSPLLYIAIIFGVIADYFLWNTIPGGWEIFGMACVIGGGILTIYFERKKGM